MRTTRTLRWNGHAFEVSRIDPMTRRFGSLFMCKTLSRFDWRFLRRLMESFRLRVQVESSCPVWGLWMCGGSNHTAGDSSFRSRMLLVEIRLTAAVDIFWTQSRVQTLGRKRTG